MILAIVQALGQLPTDPNEPADLLGLVWVSKSIVLILTLLYIFFAARVWVQVRRLERWLPVLQGHGFSVWALVHLGLAILGFILIILVL